MSENQMKYRLDTDENRAFLRSMTEDLLRFGHGFPSPGGSSYYLRSDGSPWKEHVRETYVTSRMVHVYTLGHFLGHEGSDALIDAGLKGLSGELHDDKNDGWYVDPGLGFNRYYKTYNQAVKALYLYKKYYPHLSLDGLK